MSDWKTLPCFSRLPEPIFEIPIDDFKVPVLELKAEEYCSAYLHGKNVRIIAAACFMFPPGNIKRIPAGYIVDTMIERGTLKPGDRPVDSTSGSMGTALGYCAKRRGLDAIVVVADSIPEGKLLPLRRYGVTVATESEVVARLGLGSSPGITVLTERFCEAFGYVYLNQYANPLNPESYETLLAPGLWEGVGGHASALIAAVGTGGTIIGLGRYFKRRNPNLKVISTFPYLGQSMGGARDKMRQGESKQPIAGIVDVEEPIDVRVVKAVMSDLSEKGIHGGETTGAVIGAIDHYLLQEAAMGRLEDLRTEDGYITAITVFPDTEWPY